MRIIFNGEVTGRYYRLKQLRHFILSLISPKSLIISRLVQTIHCGQYYKLFAHKIEEPFIATQSFSQHKKTYRIFLDYTEKIATIIGKFQRGEGLKKVIKKIPMSIWVGGTGEAILGWYIYISCLNEDYSGVQSQIEE